MHPTDQMSMACEAHGSPFWKKNTPKSPAWWTPNKKTSHIPSRYHYNVISYHPWTNVTEVTMPQYNSPATRSTQGLDTTWGSCMFQIRSTHGMPCEYLQNTTVNTAISWNHMTLLQECNTEILWVLPRLLDPEWLYWMLKRLPCLPLRTNRNPSKIWGNVNTRLINPPN